MNTGELVLWIVTSALAVGALVATFIACGSSTKRAFIYRDAQAM